MKITMKAEDLYAALSGHVAPSPTTLPILAYARIQGGSLITTDLDMICVAKFDCVFAGKPDFLIPCKPTLEILKGKSGPLTLEYRDEGPDDLDDASQKRSTIMRHGPSSFEFEPLPGTHYPTALDAPMLSLELDGDAFKKAIERVFFAISSEESRYVLNGALFRVHDGTLSLIATDGHRMSLVDMPTDLPNVKDTLLLRPALKWLMENIVDGPVTLGLGDGNHAVKTGRKTLIFRRLSGQFPNWQAVVPNDKDIKVTAQIPSTRELRSQLASVALCAHPLSKPVKWHFGKEGSRIAAKSTIGASQCNIDCEVDGDITIGWNAEYVTDLLDVAYDEPLTIQMSDSTSAAMFLLDGMRYVAMPMRI